MSTIKKEANRELNTKIAERVMGWESQYIEYGGTGGEYVWVMPNGKWQHKPDVPEYSTNIKEALLVVEKMEELYGFKGHNGFLITKVDDKYYVEFPLPNWQDGESKSLPEAICLAALAAVEDE